MGSGNNRLSDLQDDSNLELVAKHLTDTIGEVHKLALLVGKLVARQKLIFEQLAAMRETITVLEQIGPITERELGHGYKRSKKS